MKERRTISVPCVAYNRAKAYANTIDISLAGFISKILTEELAAAGVSDDDPGTPKLPRLRSEGAQGGPRTSFSLSALLYRRARVHAASLGKPLSTYVVMLVEVELAFAGVGPGDPGPQTRGRGGRLPGRSPSPSVSPGSGPLTPTSANLSPSPSPAQKDPALVAEDEARCAEALDNVGMSSAGIFLL